MVRSLGNLKNRKIYRLTTVSSPCLAYLQEHILVDHNVDVILNNPKTYFCFGFLSTEKSGCLQQNSLISQENCKNTIDRPAHNSRKGSLFPCSLECPPAHRHVHCVMRHITWLCWLIKELGSLQSRLARPHAERHTSVSMKCTLSCAFCSRWMQDQ